MTEQLENINITSLRKMQKELNDTIYKTDRQIHNSDIVKAEFVKLEEAQKRYNQVISDQRTLMVKPLREKLQTIENKIDEINSQKIKQSEPPLSISNLLKECKRGTDWGPKPFHVKWWSKSERFFIVTVPGHVSWAGRGEQAYRSSRHHFMDCSKAESKHGYSGHSLFMDLQLHECEGRLTKEIKQQWIDEAMEMEKNGQ